MKKFLAFAWTLACFLLIIIYIFSSISSFIPPSSFSWISLAAIGFPYVLAIFLLVCFINFFVQRRLGYFMLILLPLSYFNVTNIIAFRKEKKWVDQKDPGTLRILTWNVQGFSHYLSKKKSKSAYLTNREEMLGTLQQYHPDIICFQEYTNVENSKKRVPVRKEMDSLGYKYFFCSNDRVKINPRSNVRFEDGVVIFSKYPLLDSERINISHSYKNENLIYADLLFNNKRLRIFTAHLQSFAIYEDTANEADEENSIFDITYQRRKVVQYKIREIEIAHQQEVNIIRKVIDESPYPVIYCGDLNTTPSSYNYHFLKGTNFRDAFIEKGSGIGSTFYSVGPTLRIDVCFADKVFEVLQCKRIQKKLSDHYPVIANVTWKR
jgi:endonuclease/exonuclease/phosphatase family metal-dependent hydrolase